MDKSIVVFFFGALFVCVGLAGFVSMVFDTQRLQEKNLKLLVKIARHVGMNEEEIFGEEKKEG